MIMESPKQTRKRFVVFLDIMGFKERVARNTQESLYEELTDFNRDITTIINSHPSRSGMRHRHQSAQYQ